MYLKQNLFQSNFYFFWGAGLDEENKDKNEENAKECDRSSVCFAILCDVCFSIKFESVEKETPEQKIKNWNMCSSMWDYIRTFDDKNAKK